MPVALRNKKKLLDGVSRPEWEVFLNCPQNFLCHENGPTVVVGFRVECRDYRDFSGYEKFRSDNPDWLSRNSRRGSGL